MIEIISDYWRSFLWTDGFNTTGVAMTLWLLIASAFFGFLLSLPLSVMRASSNVYLRAPVWFYTYLFRGIPLYVQLLIVYTGIYNLDYVRSSPMLSGFFREGINCAILTLSLCTCAYTTEIFAGAIRSIPNGQLEAARSFGMSPFAIYRRLVLPAALRRALPAYSNEMIILLHTTSLAFTLTVPDILKIARDVNSATYQSFTAFSIAGLLYAFIAFALIFIFRQMEKRFLSYQRAST